MQPGGPGRVLYVQIALLARTRSPLRKPWLAGRHPVPQRVSPGPGSLYAGSHVPASPRGPVRPRGARCRPSRDAATAFIPGRRPWAAAERAVSPQAKVALRPAGIEPLGGALPASDPAGAPVDRAGGTDHADALRRVSLSVRREEVQAARPPSGGGLPGSDRPASHRERPRAGEGDLVLASNGNCIYNRQHSANAASCERSLLPA
jgi:hypothetical protein